ncbi:helix-turn-helix domain-containing protein [Corynebacterium halotolerans]|uniref:helix-turn-helix domain-containing protein n=1 Tax=Corynebacterium halotolerans TaxID=225326 RepID=UPI003CF039E0
MNGQKTQGGTTGALQKRTFGHETGHRLLWLGSGAAEIACGRTIYTLTREWGLWLPAGTAPAQLNHEGVQCRELCLQSGSAALSADITVVRVTPLLRLLLSRLDDPAVTDESRSLTTAMIADLLESAEDALVVEVPAASVLEPIVTALLAEPGHTLTLDQWARELQVSTKTITRAFQRETGLGFTGWRSAVRARAAVEWLAAGMDPADVASRSGYHSASAFGAAFRRVTGRTPGDFRPCPVMSPVD